MSTFSLHRDDPEQIAEFTANTDKHQTGMFALLILIAKIFHKIEYCLVKYGPPDLKCPNMT